MYTYGDYDTWHTAAVTLSIQRLFAKLTNVKG